MVGSVPLVTAVTNNFSEHIKTTKPIASNNSWLFFLDHNSLRDVNYGPCQTHLVKAIYSVHG